MSFFKRPIGSVKFREPENSPYNKINKFVLTHMAFYLELDEYYEDKFNVKTMIFIFKTTKN